MQSPDRLQKITTSANLLEISRFDKYFLYHPL